MNAIQCEPCDDDHSPELLLLDAQFGIGPQPQKCDVLKLKARHCTCYCEDVPTKCACEGCDRAEIRVERFYQTYCLRCGPNSPDSVDRQYTLQCRCQTRYPARRHLWDWMLCQCVDDLCKARTRTKIGELNPLCPRCKECTKSHTYVVNFGTLVEDKRYMHCTCSCPKEDLRVATHDHLYLQATGQQTPVDDRALPPPPPLKSSSRVTLCGCPSNLCHRTDMTHYLFPDGKHSGTCTECGTCTCREITHRHCRCAHREIGNRRSPTSASRSPSTRWRQRSRSRSLSRCRRDGREFPLGRRPDLQSSRIFTEEDSRSLAALSSDDDTGSFTTHTHTHRYYL